MDRDAVRIGQSAEDSELTRTQRHRAVRNVAASAADADDCRMLLDALGLLAEDGIQVPADGYPHRKAG